MVIHHHLNNNNNNKNLVRDSLKSPQDSSKQLLQLYIKRKFTYFIRLTSNCAIRHHQDHLPPSKCEMIAIRYEDASCAWHVTNKKKSLIAISNEMLNNGCAFDMKSSITSFYHLPWTLQLKLFAKKKQPNKCEDKQALVELLTSKSKMRNKT